MKKFTRGRIEGFLKTYATAESVLDIGSGGTDYADIFPNRTTLDIDPARKPDIVGDVLTMPFADESYGTIICSEVFEHLTDPQRAVAEIHRVLKPGGLLVLTTRFAFPLHDAPGDYFRYTQYGLRYLFNGWEILTLEAEKDAFGTIAVLLQRIIFQTNVRGGKLTKGILYLLALCFDRADFLIRTRYGDIGRNTKEEIILSSGIYLACRRAR